MTECPVCPHPVEGHDIVAQRWCKATTSAFTIRDCVCPAPPMIPSPRTRAEKRYDDRDG